MDEIEIINRLDFLCVVSEALEKCLGKSQPHFSEIWEDRDLVENRPKPMIGAENPASATFPPLFQFETR